MNSITSLGFVSMTHTVRYTKLALKGQFVKSVRNYSSPLVDAKDLERDGNNLSAVIPGLL
jgi:hypothetical protein